MRINQIVAGVLLCGALSHLNAQDQPMSLEGTWRFQLDRADAGLTENWAVRALPDQVQVPADLAAQGIGDPPSLDTKWIGDVQHPSWFKQPELAQYSKPDNFKFPYWLTPERRYMGASWFQRDIEIPANWSGKRAVLFIERSHWETRVWVDGKPIGTNTALATPHEYDLGPLSPGKHVLTVRIDNRLVVDVGVNSHSVSDHTQGNWHGMVGRIELRSRPDVWIDELLVYPEVGKKTFRVVGKIGTNSKGGMSGVMLEVQRRPGDPKRPGETEALVRGRVPVTWTTNGGTFEWKPTAAEARALETWDEFAPNVYRLTATLQANKAALNVPLGLREIKTSGTQFLVNGRKAFFRGTLECAIFPKTGHPPTDVDAWKRILGIARAHGLNMLRFHSWCPPEAAFVAADEMGFYYQVEVSSWANQSSGLGDGGPIDQWIYDETDRILKYYGNHPSFILLPYGNEPGGRNHKEYLAKWVEHYRAQDPRRLYTSGSGWPQIKENEFHVTPDPRVQGWGEGLKSRINAKPPETETDYRDYIKKRSVPVISHEIGQWCVYPNFEEIAKYTGYLKARNFDIFRDSLNANHMGHLAKQFLLASGKLQALCYKEDIESALRTPGMGGFQLLDLHDFPGQGTALVGVLDPFWEEKGYISAREYNRFCNSVVPLARMTKRVFTAGESFQADIEVANFGAAPLEQAVADWKLVGTDGQTWASGKLNPQTAPVDNGIILGQVRADLSGVKAPAQGKLVVHLEGTPFENDWDIWVYPPPQNLPAPPEVLVTDRLTEEAIAKLNNGGKVLLLIAPNQVKPDPKLGKVAVGFSSIFWNTAWTGRQPPHTLGILCDPKSPMLAAFPTDYHSNWQWWYLISRSGAMILDQLPAELEPTVRLIDDWVTNRRLGLAFEAKVGAGKLVVCSVDLQQEMAGDPVRSQFRRSLLDYMAGDRFAPKASVTVDQVKSLMVEPSRMQKYGARIRSASSAEAGHEPENAIDGNVNSFWHTRYRDMQPEFPHHLIIELKQSLNMAGLTVMPRQDGLSNGNIKDYAVYLSMDGQTWGEPVVKGAFAAGSTLQTIKFAAPREGRFIKLEALSGHAKGPWAAVAEIELVPGQ